MFGAKKNAIVAKVLHINFSAETITDRNFEKIKEYCHITYDCEGYIQHLVLDVQFITFVSTEEYTDVMISFVTNALSGVTKGAELLIPKNISFNLL